MNRLKTNLEILEFIKKYLEDNPDMRLGQALVNLNLVSDVFYEEPEEMLNRIKLSVQN